jgi:tetratricopeptide (TPR) repeat protein
MLRLRSLKSVLLLSALVAVTMAPESARAQTTAADTARATELFKNGKVAFSKGDMAEAEQLFAQALTIRRSSDIAANLGQSQLEQQKYRAAAENFAWALANMLPSATDAQRKAVEHGLARARAEVAMLRLDIKPDCADVLVGEHAVGKAPLPAGVYVEPGEVIVAVRHDGFIAIDKRVMVGKGTEQAIEIALAPKSDEQPPTGAAPGAVNSGLEADAGVGPADRAPARSLVPAYVATGVAVAGGVAGLVFTLTANSKENDADELRDQLATFPGGCNGDAPQTDCDDLAEQRQSVDTSRNLALGAFVVGGVAAVVAGYFYWDALSHRNREAKREPRLYGLVPSIDVGRARATDAASVGSVKLSVSGNF